MIDRLDNSPTSSPVGARLRLMACRLFVTGATTKKIVSNDISTS